MKLKEPAMFHQASKSLALLRGDEEIDKDRKRTRLKQI